MKINFNTEVLQHLMPDAQRCNIPPHVLAKNIILEYYSKKEKEHE